MSTSLKTANPASKHVHTAVQHAKMKGVSGPSLNCALMTYGLIETYGLSPQDALLMTKSVYAYAASLMMKRAEIVHGARGDLEELKADILANNPEGYEWQKDLEQPPFLRGHFN